MTNLLQLVGGPIGGVVITATATATAIEGTLIRINANAVFTDLEVDGVSVMTERGLTGATVAAGAVLGSGYNYVDNIRAKFTSVNLASGSIIVY
jgi:hypothetical protein